MLFSIDTKAFFRSPNRSQHHKLPWVKPLFLLFFVIKRREKSRSLVMGTEFAQTNEHAAHFEVQSEHTALLFSTLSPVDSLVFMQVLTADLTLHIFSFLFSHLKSSMCLLLLPPSIWTFWNTSYFLWIRAEDIFISSSIDSDLFTARDHSWLLHRPPERWPCHLVRWWAKLV